MSYHVDKLFLHRYSKLFYDKEMIEDFIPDLPVSRDGSIEHFFDKINLTITFEDPFFHYEMTNMFKHFKHEYPNTDDDIVEELKASYEYETNKQMEKQMYDALLNTDNIIVKLYNIIEPKLPVKRNKAVHVNDGYGTVYTGAKQSYVNIDILQNWVNEFHSYEFENNLDKLLAGFILYLLYVRIHPHLDGNGRISRYLFLENKLMKKNLLPLSKILNDDLELPSYHMNEVFNWLDATVDAKTAKQEDYYKLFVPNDVLYKIYYIMYIAICYKYCCSICKNFKNNLRKAKDYLYMFCVCKGFHEVGKSTTVRIDDVVKSNNQKFARWLDMNFFDWKRHCEIVNKVLKVICERMALINDFS